MSMKRALLGAVMLLGMAASAARAATLFDNGGFTAETTTWNMSTTSYI